MDNSPFGPRWVEVNLDAIRHNYRQIRQRLDRQVKILSVVKADAYGHGALEVARLLESAGTDMLGVTTVDEGKKLREGKVSVPILVFGPFLPEEMETIAEHGLTATVSALEALSWLKQAPLRSGRPIKLHLKVETGMGRSGLWPDQVVEAAEEIMSRPGLVLEGVYSHLATAMWPDKSYALHQFRVFQQAVNKLEKAGINGLIRHISNSAAIVALPEMQLDMVRVGTLLYGQYPHPRMAGVLDLQDPWTMKAKVLQVRELPAGHSVGYGRTYKTSRRTKIALLPVGFVDGLQVEPVLKPVNLWELVKGMIKLILQYLNYTGANQAFEFPQGKGSIIGKVGMQLTVVDVTGVPGVEVGTAARVPVRRTAVSPAIPRVYLEGDKVRGFNTQIGG